MLILAVLVKHGELYGIEIQDNIIKQFGIEFSTSSIYGTLSKLQDKNSIDISHLSEPTSERGGRRKLFFQITNDGKKICK